MSSGMQNKIRKFLAINKKNNLFESENSSEIDNNICVILETSVPFSH